jgi:hypothetical protein
MNSALSALEKNILKYRAIQMILLLHQVEFLRIFIIESIRQSDEITKTATDRLSVGIKNPMEKAMAILVQEDILTKSESEDFQSIVEHRNQIAHKIHEAVEDISSQHQYLNRRKQVYDYYALDRFEKYREKITAGMMKKFILKLNFRDLSFERAEAAYKEELSRLQKRIDRQYEAKRALLLSA